MELQEYTFNRKTYFVDYRLKQFRTKANYPKPIEFVSFYDELGERILSKLIRDNKANWQLLHI